VSLWFCFKGSPSQIEVHDPVLGRSDDESLVSAIQIAPIQVKWECTGWRDYCAPGYAASGWMTLYLVAAYRYSQHLCPRSEFAGASIKSLADNGWVV